MVPYLLQYGKCYAAGEHRPPRANGKNKTPCKLIPIGPSLVPSRLSARCLFGSLALLPAMFWQVGNDAYSSKFHRVCEAPCPDRGERFLPCPHPAWPSSPNDAAHGCEAARLSFPVHPHMLRHSTGYKLANDGHDTRLPAHYLGHRNLQSTARYTALAEGRFAKFWRAAEFAVIFKSPLTSAIQL
jgi:Phage integrase family